MTNTNRSAHEKTSIEDIVRQIARLAIDTADAVAPLVQDSGSHRGPSGEVAVHQSAIDRAFALQSSADSLRRLCGIARPIRSGSPVDEESN